MRLVFVFFIAVFFYACSNSVGIEPVDDSIVELGSDSFSGMIRVTAVRANVVLGTNDTLAAFSERPSMKVKLDYSFSIGRHEVTCAEFNELMKPATGLSLDCAHDSIPATDVTYYDAVLFANEKSKSESQDTFYTYSAVRFDEKKHCIGIEGLVYHPEVEGFRLPTEAEWVLIAKRNWNPSKAWTSGNSDYKLHKVCGFESDSLKPCDMVGNAMEWVNDWLGFFKDTTITNYVGSPDGGSLGERIVKGGSYQNSESSIKIYNRGDVYTVTSSTRAPYVGFRLAFGKIPDATWVGYNGVVATSRVAVLLNTTSIRAVTNTYKMKLAFRNHVSGNLSYIDYSTGTLYVAEIVDTLPVYHPEISPDGRYAAFCTGLEGVSGKSQLYVRALDLTGAGLVKLDVESAAIPRWRVLDNGDTAIVYVSDVGNNKDDASFRKTSTWQVVFKKGRFRKLVKLFDGAYHGGISLDNRLTVSGARLLRARIANSNSTVMGSARDTVWYNGEQACNVSLSRDSAKKTLFLDFGGNTGREFAGEKYGTHERLLVADSAGNLVQSVAAPSGYSFDHAEWVQGRSDLAVATLTNLQGAHTKIVLVKIDDGKILELAEGEEVWHPNFWVSAPMDFSKYDLDPDSAGVYMDADDELSAVLMRFKMQMIWQYHDSANVVVLGSSRPLNAVCSKCFSSRFFAVNLSQTPNSIYTSRNFLDAYVYRHFKLLKYIIVSLDIDFWYKEEAAEGDDFFEKSYARYPGYVYDKNHNYWESGVPEGLLEYTQNYLTVADEPLFVEDRGRLLGIPCRSRGDEAELELDSAYYDDKQYLLDNSYDALESII